ncbi:hypothetical protein AGMMS4952_23880 [Spirochaetia bacterium]|nr:hypothetical protein AGMMS4952_23880 [Spirochaetia bacterium]
MAREFEVYVTDKKPGPGEKAPAESLAGYGEWVTLENGSNRITTQEIAQGKLRLLATFSSVPGRYVQFRFVSAYRNHWNGYPRTAKIANAAELTVSVTGEPYTINKGNLSLALGKAEALRSAYLPKYGYTNAILDNWTGKGQSYLTGKATKEMVDYVLDNLNAYIAQAPGRMTGAAYNRFIPKILWADDKGNHLQAHGGGVMYDPVGQQWWFYGEDRTYNGGGQAGVHGYSSRDLYNWKDEGLALPVFNNTVYDTKGWKADDWDGDTNLDAAHKPGFIQNVNVWRKALGDWNADGLIDSSDAPYRLTDTALRSEISARIAPRVFRDEYDLVTAGDWPTAAAAWDKVKDHIPQENPPLFIAAGADANPHPGSLGLDSGKIGAFNALYRDVPVWRRKQLYRYYNYQTIIERPKVVYNPNVSERYTDSEGTYPYMMFIHIEGGTYDSSYGTARVAIAAAKQPQGPYKLLWAYHTHFSENYHHSDNGNNRGMTRDQGVLVDTDGNAYQFGSTEENRIMGINKLRRSYEGIEGIPLYAGGGNEIELLQEGYQNKMGENFNWLYGVQREAPAPFIHYETNGETMDNSSDGTKRYYAVTSYSSGWYPNAQGLYRTAGAGFPILGNNPHDKPAPGQHNTMDNVNAGANDTAPGTGVNAGTGWTNAAYDAGPNSYSNFDGTAATLLFGVAGDGSAVPRGYDGQTTNIFQLRYPDHPWGLVGYSDAGYVPVNPSSYSGNPAAYYAAIEAQSGYTKPLYGERPELPELRAGKLVYGKYVYLSDSWDQYKNYDARYIWLPMRVLPGSNDDSLHGPKGAKIRWMNQWRWQDFVYDLGPFKDSISDPAASLWTNNSQDELTAYDEMLGAIDEYKKNAGKQNPGLLN